MRRSLTFTSAVLLLALTGCSSAASTTGSSDAASPTTAASPISSATAQSSSAASAPITATAAMKLLAAKISTAKQTGVITEDNDSNKLIGRPHEYTSKVTFKDSRIPVGDTSSFKAGDVELGGAVEVFATPADAAARAKYIQTATASLPALAEYDYVHGDVLVRVSHFIKPGLAKGYDQAVASIG
jgi:hypothetical protein